MAASPPDWSSPPPLTRPLRVAFCGTPDFAVASLVALCAQPQRFEVCAVITQPDRPAGRRRQLCAPPVKREAQQRGLVVHQWRKLRDGQAEQTLRDLGLDALVVAAYGRILPPALLGVARLGAINVHASLLPRWRGASPIARAIWAGDAQTGVAIMGMDEGLDTGPVYAMASVSIGAQETTPRLTERLAVLGAQLLADTLPNIAAGLLAAPQPTDGVCHAPPLTKEDGALCFDGPAVALARQVRALQPWPGTYAFLHGERLGIVQAEAQPHPEAAAAPAGTIIESSPRGVWVACRPGALRLLRVKPAGRNEMETSGWIAGRAPIKGATLSHHGPPVLAV